MVYCIKSFITGTMIYFGNSLFTINSTRVIPLGFIGFISKYVIGTILTKPL